MIKKVLKTDLFPFLILFVCVSAYGLLSPFLGFYWDDIPYMWFNHTNGPLGALRAIALDRPVLGLFYALPLSLMGESPFAWQLFAVICRWIFILCVYYFLNSLFHENKNQNKLIILLFAVFPGFSQQFISVIYAHAFLIFGVYFFSLILFITSLLNDSFLPYGLVSLILSLISMAATEYLVGLEALRPLIIYLVIYRKYKEFSFREQIKTTVIRWIPYLSAGLAFVMYRIFFASSVLYQVQATSAFKLNPLAAIINLVSVILNNIFQVFIASWIKSFNPIRNYDPNSLASIFYLGILFVVFSFTLIGIFFIMKKNSNPFIFSLEKKYSLSLLLGSAAIVVFAGLPFWAANLKIETAFPADRFLLPFMLAASAILFLFISLVSFNKYFFALLFSIIFSFSFSSQFYQANEYRNDWENFKELFGQISWRIPSLKENTLLVTDELTLKYYSDNSLTAALNWIYAARDQKSSLPYLINYSKARLGYSLPSLQPATKVTHNYRTHKFSGSTDRMIIFYYIPPGCFHIADPDLDPFNPLINSEIRIAAALSKPDLVLSDISQNQSPFTKPGEANTWCFYYQKASLAVQNHDWVEAAHIGDIAFNLDDYPNDASERLPFIEAYAMTGNVQKAIDLTLITYEVSDLYQPMLCHLWERIESRGKLPENSKNLLREMKLTLNCW